MFFFLIFKNVENVIVNSATFTFGPWAMAIDQVQFLALRVQKFGHLCSEQKRLDDKHLVLHIHTHLNVKVFVIS